MLLSVAKKKNTYMCGGAYFFDKFMAALIEIEKK